MYLCENTEITSIFLSSWFLILPYIVMLLIKKYKYICTKMFIATLICIAPNWKQVECSSTEEKINCSIHMSMEYYMATKMKTTARCNNVDESHGHNNEQKKYKIRVHFMIPFT